MTPLMFRLATDASTGEIDMWLGIRVPNPLKRGVTLASIHLCRGYNNDALG